MAARDHRQGRPAVVGQEGREASAWLRASLRREEHGVEGSRPARPLGIHEEAGEASRTGRARSTCAARKPVDRRWVNSRRPVRWVNTTAPEVDSSTTPRVAGWPFGRASRSVRSQGPGLALEEDDRIVVGPQIGAALEWRHLAPRVSRARRGVWRSRSVPRTPIREFTRSETGESLSEESPVLDLQVAFVVFGVARARCRGHRVSRRSWRAAAARRPAPARRDEARRPPGSEIALQHVAQGRVILLDRWRRVGDRAGEQTASSGMVPLAALTRVVTSRPARRRGIRREPGVARNSAYLPCPPAKSIAASAPRNQAFRPCIAGSMAAATRRAAWAGHRVRVPAGLGQVSAQAASTSGRSRPRSETGRPARRAQARISFRRGWRWRGGPAGNEVGDAHERARVVGDLAPRRRGSDRSTPARACGSR